MKKYTALPLKYIPWSMCDSKQGIEKTWKEPKNVHTASSKISLSNRIRDIISIRISIKLQLSPPENYLAFHSFLVCVTWKPVIHLKMRLLIPLILLFAILGVAVGQWRALAKGAGRGGGGGGGAMDVLRRLRQGGQSRDKCRNPLSPECWMGGR